jgi:hypothetical protein
MRIYAYGFNKKSIKQALVVRGRHRVNWTNAVTYHIRQQAALQRLIENPKSSPEAKASAEELVREIPVSLSPSLSLKHPNFFFNVIIVILFCFLSK